MLTNEYFGKSIFIRTPSNVFVFGSNCCLTTLTTGDDDDDDDAEAEAENDVDTASLFDTLSLENYEISSLPSVYNAPHTYPASPYPAWGLDEDQDEDEDVRDGNIDNGNDTDNNISSSSSRHPPDPDDEEEEEEGRLIRQ